ncbi:MAG: PRC-barrel domain-containing protein [Chloroflexi bacterium]|nr:PRC-barrel domain-containing protein [Chloroflexota bacterium]
MQIKLGAKVYSSDEQQLGTVSHVILYPGTKEVTHLVVQKAGTQALVPADLVYSADEKRIVLRQAAQDWTQFPAFQPGGDVPAQVDPDLRNIPEGTVALKEGAKVITSDGQNVGNLEHFNTTENRITDLFITKGKLLKTRRLVQSELISSVLENEIRLTVDAEFVNSLPEPRPEMQQI